jgi:endonuclease YncB( thermonuclease family)
MDAWRAISSTLGDYSTRPQAGWRQATEALDKIGEAREGQPIPHFDLSGRVVRVADGDTVSVLDSDNKQHKVRLFGIDTPERDQHHGKAAKKALAALVAGKTVGVVSVEKDSYGRTVGTLYLHDTNINAAMVQGGHAWWYRHYAPHNRLLAAMEQQAREAKRGLWTNPEPVPPWDWRRNKRYNQPR